MKLHSTELKSMNEHIVSVVTRAQNIFLEENERINVSVNKVSNYERIHHPKVVEILKKAFN